MDQCIDFTPVSMIEHQRVWPDVKHVGHGGRPRPDLIQSLGHVLRRMDIDTEIAATRTTSHSSVDPGTHGDAQDHGYVTDRHIARQHHTGIDGHTRWSLRLGDSSLSLTPRILACCVDMTSNRPSRSHCSRERTSPVTGSRYEEFT